MIELAPVIFEDPNILTVTQLNQLVQELLAQQVGSVWLCGEISNCCQPTSGHCYFTLKDAQAQVRCVLFYHRRSQLMLQPKNGLQVLVTARMSLYTPRGDFQLVIENLQPLGMGLLQQQLAQLKQQLADEGLFAPQHKKPLPRAPQRVGIITSVSGAALQDILQILNRRDPSLPIVIYPSAVQGDTAPDCLIQALQAAGRRQECDVLILARGGGSLEDLWSFNRGDVAYAIFACPIPIISAIGHETDVTIADLVADVRAPTPSAAAELVSRDQQEQFQQLASLRQHMRLAIEHLVIARQRTILLNWQQQLHKYPPSSQLLRRQATLVQIQLHLRHCLTEHWQRQQAACQRWQQLLWQHTPLRQQPRQQLQKQHSRLQQALQQYYQASQQQFAILCARLQSASPLAILSRGFSLTLDLQGKPLRSVEQVWLGETIKTRVTDGWLSSVVTQLIPTE